ncbi:MAG: hypothetical protein ACE5DN_02575 [Flavobacteriales bacterium]
MNHKSALLIAVTIFAFTSTLMASAPDTSTNVWTKGLDKVKLQKARHLFLINDFDAALKVYLEIAQKNQGNALVNYRLGECNCKLRNYDVCVNYLEKAYRIDADVNKELHLLYASALHRLGEFDRALAHCAQFRQMLAAKSNKMKEMLGSDKLLTEDIDKLEANIKFAREMMDKPVHVKIANMGASVNSPTEDYRPAISADGKTLIFTSRRPDSKGGIISPEDHKYFEDIYISVLDEQTGQWSVAEGIQGRLNTDEHDACLGISPDGKQIFIYKNIEGLTRSGDIYLSKLSSSGRWSTPKPFGKTINSSYFETSASMSKDGKRLYFVSERKGGIGQGDIYMAEKISKHEWSEAVNLGAEVNTAGDENSVFVHPDEKYLIFSSDGRTSIGGYDIYISLKKDGKWSKPVNLGYPINTMDDNVHFTVRADGKKAYYSTYDKDGFGNTDIFEIDLTGYDLIPKD